MLFLRYICYYLSKMSNSKPKTNENEGFVNVEVTRNYKDIKKGQSFKKGDKRKVGAARAAVAVSQS